MTSSITNHTPITSGRALKFETPEVLAKAINEYFDIVPREEITQSGLCLHIRLGKDALNRYLIKEGYENIVMMAKLKIENAYESSLREKGGAGNIFALKNFGWHDRQEHEHSGNANNPLYTKIIREIVNVKQIEHVTPITPEEITGDSKDDLSVDAGLPAGLADLEDEYDDFLQ